MAQYSAITTGWFGATCAAWLLLGTSVHQRSGEADQRLAQEVSRLWGGHHEQLPPEIWVERPGTEVETVQEKREDGTTSLSGHAVSGTVHVDDLVRDLDYRPNTSLEFGVARFVDWYKDYYGL